MTPEQLEKLHKYLESEEGKEDLLRILEASKEWYKETRKRERPDWLAMNKPMEI